MLLRNWLTSFISLSLCGCACMSGKQTQSADVKVWVIDATNKGAWGSSRYDSDPGEFKLCEEMENYVCFAPDDIPEILRR